MIFNSIEYLIFLPIVYFVYCRLSHRPQNIFLLVASYLFYGWWDVRFLYLITLSTSIDYCCGLLISNGVLTRRQALTSLGYAVLSAVCFVAVGGYLLGESLQESVTLSLLGVCVVSLLLGFVWVLQLAKGNTVSTKVWVGFSVATNLSILGVFKYFNFFVDSMQSGLTAFGVGETSLGSLNILLPVGISFYTFQTISYSIDLYRKKVSACERYLDFALFVSYFPQLVAGPIERASHLLPMVQTPRKIERCQVVRGCKLISYGLFKKVVIADGLAGAVESVYGSTGGVSGLDITLATLLFAVQIYCDFSGYSDIARGTSKLFGIDLLKNFNLPYFSRSPSEFWQRWHISLSSWLRDYLYIPLGGNRGGSLATYKNLTLTMVLGGLWHGAAWNYALWGMYHGVLLSVYRAVPEYIFSRLNNFAITRIIWFLGGIAVFFCFTLYGWLLFRAVSLEQIAHFTGVLFLDGFLVGGLSMDVPPFSALLGLPILVGYELTSFSRESGYRLPNVLTCLKPVLVGGMIFIFIASLSAPPAQFIYFQF